MGPAEAKLSGAALKLTSDPPCYTQVSECQGSARVTTCLLMCVHRVMAIPHPQICTCPHPSMVFRRRGGIKGFQGRDPSKDALLRIGSGSPGMSANLVVEAIIAHHGLLATRVQMSSSRWYGGIATRLTEIRARLEMWEIEHINDLTSPAPARSLLSGSELPSHHLATLHRQTGIALYTISSHRFAFPPPLPRVEDDSFSPR